MDIKHESHADYYVDPYLSHHHHHNNSSGSNQLHGIPPHSAGSSGSGPGGVRQGSAGAAGGGSGDGGFKCEYPGCTKTFTRKVRRVVFHSRALEPSGMLTNA